MYRPLSEYAVVGDMHSAALVGLNGSIDWLCFPRFGSPWVFGAILDHDMGGRFQIAPAQHYHASQRYLSNSNVLETVFTTATGTLTLIDFMPLGVEIRESPHQLVRIARCIEGSVDVELLFQPRLDATRGQTTVELAPNGARALKDDLRLSLSTDAPLEVRNGAAHGRFPLRQGQEAAFVVHWQQPFPLPVSTYDVAAWLDWTDNYWRVVASELNYRGRWRERVVRSLLALHLLVYAPTGAICAAVTTSLPENIGGSRNWDYRYCWLRDAAFTLDLFHRLGHTSDTTLFMQWLDELCRTGCDLQPLYSVDFTTDLTETILDHLEGYRESRPVRMGNAACHQFQLDIFGDIMLVFSTYYKARGHLPDAMWQRVQQFAEAAATSWRQPDLSIWEVRGQRRHFVYSKVLCWTALDRAAYLARATGHNHEAARWQHVKDEIYHDVMAHGWNQQRRAFVQSYGSDNLDASVLIIPMIGFLPATDPRMRSTIEAIRGELSVNGLLRRYVPEATDDGFTEDEGAFTMCSLWLAGCLLLQGRVLEARELFEGICNMSNHVGIFSEMVNPHTGEALGNLPQAFTHIAFVHTARNLDAALDKFFHGKPAPEAWDRPALGVRV
ncbi:MAG: glycoside hydrolase family 15 protein [Dehalococcoidia bacterium]